jgi:3-oxoacyl-[acyl-carrier protein] reductase
MHRLKEKVSIVTGAGRGIGRGIALRFAREGAKVAVVDLNQVLADKTALEITQAGGESLACQADVSSNTDVGRFVTDTLQRYGGLDILVNNAGIGGSKTCLDTTQADWDRMVAVNLKSVFLVCRRVIPAMLERGGGKIINIASMYGMLASVHTLAYSASKAGVISITRQLAVDYSGKQINVNSISPGLIETEMTRSKIENPEIMQRFLDDIPLGRHGSPEDLAGAAVFLASPDADFITGHNLVVDGGQSCRVT